jgi:hypothetical protein
MGKHTTRARAFLACALLGAWACHAPTIDQSGDDSSDTASPPERSTATAAEAAAPSAMTTTTSPLDAGRIDAASCGGGACDGSADATATGTFTLGSTDCNGGHCKGGYGGTKDPTLLPTATEQCVVRGFPRAIDFTIGGQPGGDFCVYEASKYSCDSSCDGCDTMKTIACERP